MTKKDLYMAGEVTDEVMHYEESGIRNGMVVGTITQFVAMEDSEKGEPEAVQVGAS